ncbi:MAG: hypothetical protein Kow0062_04130 [Acidobacteriota bacterium]
MAKVRDQILASLLSGRYRPGEKAPSVRRMAALTGRSRRSVHEAYRQLAAEGLLEVRWGSGTFFAETHPLALAPETSAPPPALPAIPLELRRLAERLELGEAGLARLVAYWAGYARDHVELAVVECNGEQRGLMARELGETLGVRCREIDLAELGPAGARLRRVSAIVTSCCHRDEVAPFAEAAGRPLFTVSMDPGFLPPLLDALARGPLVMIVRDRAYGPVLSRFLETLRLPPEQIARLAVVEPDGLIGALAERDRPGALYVSPLVRDRVGRLDLDGWRELEPRRFVARDEVDHLWAHLAWLRARAQP